MILALSLLLIIVAIIVFHWLSPWWLTPQASNWGQIDDSFNLTLWITGVFFIAINLFIAYVLFRFRASKGRRADYQPENPKLEWTLIGLTTVGIVGILGPGLIIYADYVRPPKAVMRFEVVGQQWHWGFRFPGQDGTLGRSQPALISLENPFGLDKSDPDALDDVLIIGPELHLPVNQPFQVLLRSRDVLHDFFVPQFRIKMDLVPGRVSKFWFEPTELGRYEILCAEYCGVGHWAMRGEILVEERVKFEQWLASKPTFADTLPQPAAEPTPETAPETARNPNDSSTDPP